jgi:(E)-4-hydroxy-3-methylbut-2-enyl-diphosphate synthase
MRPQESAVAGVRRLIMPQRKKTRRVMIGGVPIGGGAPIAVQSMTKSDTRDVKATVREIGRLQDVGCEIVRCAVPDREAAQALGDIARAIEIPLVADIHFDYRLALEALKQGVAALRINPGNIGGAARVRKVVEAARERGVPIRIGVNSGSLERRLLKKYKHPTAEALVESAMAQLGVLEEMGFRDVKISVKATSVPMTIRAYRLLSRRTNCPLHLGITEAGTSWAGSINSAVGIGILLAEGIGDTIRVSLTADPVEEVRAAYQILKSLGLREHGPTLISCPSCGRAQLDIERVALEVERRLARVKAPLKVAVMGCAVNGPGEAKEADVGLAAGKGGGLIFRDGVVVRKVKEARLVAELLKEAEKAAEAMSQRSESGAAPPDSAQVSSNETRGVPRGRRGAPKGRRRAPKGQGKGRTKAGVHRRKARGPRDEGSTKKKA